VLNESKRSERTTQKDVKKTTTELSQSRIEKEKRGKEDKEIGLRRNKREWEREREKTKLIGFNKSSPST